MQHTNAVCDVDWIGLGGEIKLKKKLREIWIQKVYWLRGITQYEILEFDKNTFLNFFHYIKFSVSVCVNICVHNYMHKNIDIYGVQKRASNILELQEVVSHPTWALGTDVRSSPASVGTLNCRTISQVPR